MHRGIISQTGDAAFALTHAAFIFAHRTIIFSLMNLPGLARPPCLRLLSAIASACSVCRPALLLLVAMSGARIASANDKLRALARSGGWHPGTSAY
jgi:hypothetical protein